MHRDAVPNAELPDHVIKAVLATEDRRFFEHIGIDFWGLSRALTQNMRANGVVPGGSTLSQQLAKNLFLSNERTLKRKINEAFLALWLEANLSKTENPPALSGSRLYGRRHIRYCGSVRFISARMSKMSLWQRQLCLQACSRHRLNMPACPACPQPAHAPVFVLSNLADAGFMSEGQLALPGNPASVVDRAEGDNPDYFLDWAFDGSQKILHHSAA